MLKNTVLAIFLSLLISPAFAQKILITSQNHTKSHKQYAIVANKLNQYMFNKHVDRNEFKYLSHCKQPDSTVDRLAKKYRDLLPKLSYGYPTIDFSETHNSDTMWYEQTYVKLNRKKHTIKYCLQVKVYYQGTDPDGEVYFPYIIRFEVRGPGEIQEFPADAIWAKFKDRSN